MQKTKLLMVKVRQLSYLQAKLERCVQCGDDPYNEGEEQLEKWVQELDSEIQQAIAEAYGES